MIIDIDYDARIELFDLLPEDTQYFINRKEAERKEFEEWAKKEGGLF